MIWILLAALGVPLWLVIGALIAALLARRAFKHAPDVFAAKLRAVSGDAAGLKGSWSRLPVYARWVHDVLLVHQGLALVRSRALPVATMTSLMTIDGPDAPKRLGPHLTVLTLVLDNGATVELAAPADARVLMVGPFAALLASP
jgi:hypothetical protein